MNLFEKIKTLWKVKIFTEEIIKEAKMPTSIGKPGWKTTEFYFNLAAQIGTLWATVQGYVPPKWAAIIAIGGTAVYTIARTIAKAVTDIQAARLVNPT